MDEQQLTDAMRGAAADAPPPPFDAADVVQASRRITARRRAATAGAALAAVVVVGVGVGVGVRDVGAGDATVASAPVPAAPGYAQPEAAQAPPAMADAPPADAQSSGARSAVSPRPPLGPGPAGSCANRQDPQLRALVEEVLPEVVGAAEAATTRECRPGGERGVNVLVGRGVLSVEYLPPGAPVADGGVSVPTASGGTLRMVAAGGGPSPPRLAAAAAELAPRL